MSGEISQKIKMWQYQRCKRTCRCPGILRKKVVWLVFGLAFCIDVGYHFLLHFLNDPYANFWAYMRVNLWGHLNHLMMVVWILSLVGMVHKRKGMTEIPELDRKGGS